MNDRQESGSFDFGTVAGGRMIGFNVEDFGDGSGVVHTCLSCGKATVNGLGAPSPGPCETCGGIEFNTSFVINEDETLNRMHVGPKPAKRTCIFCGATPVTREHVWPQWLSRDFPGSDIHEPYPESVHPLPRKRLVDITDDTSFVLDYEDEKNHGISDATHVIKAACAGCNNAWMAALEAEIKPLLRRQITTRDDRMTEAERVLLVRWLAKTAAVYEMDDPVSAVLPEEDRRAIADRSTPLSDQWQIDAMWVPDFFDFHMAHGRVGLINADDDMGQSMFFIITAGSAGYVVQFKDRAWMEHRPMNDVPKLQLWSGYRVGRRRPRVDGRRWHDLRSGSDLYDLPGAQAASAV